MGEILSPSGARGRGTENRPPSPFLVYPPHEYFLFKLVNLFVRIIVKTQYKTSYKIAN
jgi:hypothetical protein